MRFEVINGSCANQEVDAIVNAANKYLANGGGIAGVIFEKAGVRELSDACKVYKTPLMDGEAVITPAFGIKNAKHIIHAVGPDFHVKPKAYKELYEAYYNSLVVLKDNGLHSIAFPLISAGIYGGTLPNPPAESTKQCCRAYRKFSDENPRYNLNVTLCAYTKSEYDAAIKVFNEFFDIPEEGYDRWDRGGENITMSPYPYNGEK